MPWEISTVTEQKIAFVQAYRRLVETGEMSMAALCREYHISRKSGYATISSYQRHGWQGLAGRSRAPHSGAHWADNEVIVDVLDGRREFPYWGARKVVAYLKDLEPDRRWPAPSVAHEWFKRAGLVMTRKRQRRFVHPGRPPATHIERANQRWSMDFKGQFQTRDRQLCYPLTVLDSYSRYVLACRALRGTSFELVWPEFERLFKDFGLPEETLSDGGPPFSTNSVKRLSKLMVRFIRLGITPRLIEPGKPQQNGRHERMHLDLKGQACTHPSANCGQQQKQFDRFRTEFNEIRPHESHGQKPPARLYMPSPRPYPRRLPEIEYPSTLEVRRVRSSGEIKWQGQWLFLSEALVGEPVAFELIADDCWILRYSAFELGYYSSCHRRLYLDKTPPAGKAENA